MIYRILNIISVIGSFLMVFGLIYLVLELTLGNIPVLRDLIIFEFVSFKFLLFTTITLGVISDRVSFYFPYK